MTMTLVADFFHRRWCRIAKRVAAERYGPSKKTQRDMVGSFVARGLTQEQAENEIAAQMYVALARVDSAS